MEVIHHIWAILSQWYWIPLLLIYLGIILTILIENRNPAKTIAWLLVIVFVPVIGLLIYYLFGQKFRKVQEFRKSNHVLHERIISHWGRLNPLMKANLKTIDNRIGSLGRVFHFLANERVSMPVLDNKVTLLTNGEEKFPALFEAVRAARHHIHLEYYIFEPDTIGMQLLELLGEKAAEGVQVRLIIDGFGSPQLARQNQLLEKLGIRYVVFLPVSFSSLANSNYRNHRKIALIDGQTAFVGGINIADKYFNATPEAPETLPENTERKNNQLFWRDTSVRLQGNAVNILQAYFWMDWYFAGGQVYEISADYLHPGNTAIPGGQAAVGFAFSDPGSDAPYCMEALLLAISEAQESIRLCTPYFIPSDELSTSLQLAAASGLQVELILPKTSDSYVVQHASQSFIKPLLERGVSVYLYEKGFIHAKTVCIDGKLAFVGTVNLDTRSFYINYEVSAVISDPDFCREMESQFEKDKQSSQLITMDSWLSRPRWKRGLDSVCRLLAPLL